MMLSEINSPQDLKNIDQKELPALCKEIRERIIDVMTRNGGHLASNLGSVELTVALHYVFDSPEDKIIFDVGHQCYTHKILTGRNASFDTIRTGEGLSGFTRRKESTHDFVDAGHSSTSISQAMGYAMANRLKGRDNRVVAVIGDGSLTGGVAFEGLDYTGHLDIPLIVILNDNDMSIGKNVGGLSNYINKITVSKFYQRITEIFDTRIKKSGRVVRAILRMINRLKRGFKFLFEYENVFTSLGFEYVGPVNGHDLKDLIYILEHARNNVHQPLLIHVKTTKGKGFRQAEGNPATFHGVTPSLMSGEKIEFKANKSFTEIFGQKVLELGKRDEKIVTITAAMESGTGLSLFRTKFPERFFDVGIAEQHAVSFASTLAYDGFRPIFAVYSTFLVRALDQICQDICISRAPVILAIDRAGIVGMDGETHQGQFDVSCLRMLPNMNIMAPADATELEMMLDYSHELNLPCAIRYPRDIAETSQLGGYHPPLESHPLVSLKKGKDLLIIAIGPFVRIANEAVDELKKIGLEAGLLCLRMLKPLPEELLAEELAQYSSVIIIEENVYCGSAAESIGALISARKLGTHFEAITLPDSFIEHDSRGNILKELGFTKENIVKIAALANDREGVNSL